MVKLVESDGMFEEISKNPTKKDLREGFLDFWKQQELRRNLMNLTAITTEYLKEFTAKNDGCPYIVNQCEINSNNGELNLILCCLQDKNDINICYGEEIIKEKERMELQEVVKKELKEKFNINFKVEVDNRI